MKEKCIKTFTNKDYQKNIFFNNKVIITQEISNGYLTKQ